MIKIGNIELNNIAFLAPMAGVTDYSFRTICRDFGAGLTYTEMISAKAMSYNDKKTFTLLGKNDTQIQRAVQIFGTSPEIMAETAKRIENDFSIIDINMGCPAPKIFKNGEGSALMKTPLLAGKIIEKVSKAVSIPVTVKIRKGVDSEHVNAVEIAKIAEECGAAAITVHGRTTEQMYLGKADREIIAEVKSNVSIPVIGNGDIQSGKDAFEMIQKTGCDAVMVGRGSMGNPFIFREINEFLEGKPVTKVTLQEKMDTALLHLDMLIEDKGEHIGILEARKHMAWYIKGLKNAAESKCLINTATNKEQMKQYVREIFERNM